MKVLITGAGGMLGRTLVNYLQERYEVIAAAHNDLDITDIYAVDNYIGECKPDAVIHCAAMTAVDKCETDMEAAMSVNSLGAGVVAGTCSKHNARMIHISTDYVFNGKSKRPYHEFDRPSDDLTSYGKSKLLGEQNVRANCKNHLICRVALLYGAGGPSFVHKMMSLADGTRPLLKVVSDLRSNPTSALAVARHLALLLERPELNGIFHLTCEGEATRFEFAQEIFRLAGIKQEIAPCKSSVFQLPARRPKNSCLEKRRLKLEGLPPMPRWQDALAEFMRTEFR